MLVVRQSNYRVYRAVLNREFAPLLGDLALAEIAAALEASSDPHETSQCVADCYVDEAVDYARAAWHEARAMKPKARERLRYMEQLRAQARAEMAAREDMRSRCFVRARFDEACDVAA